MDNYFLIGQAAEYVNTTSETLRHYDRIGLVKPSKKDEWTAYRYYTEQDLVKISTIRALQAMDLPLQKIKEVLQLDNLEKIIEFFNIAEKRADEKIALLKKSKAKIKTAKLSYEDKLSKPYTEQGTFIKHFPKRVIMLADTLETPSLDNLWGYLRHFYNKIDLQQRDLFEFEDLAGIYTENENSKMFAVCNKFVEINGLITLPCGDYLCANCTEDTRISKLNELMLIAKSEYYSEPKFSIQQIIISGILQWNYEIQIYLR